MKRSATFCLVALPLFALSSLAAESTATKTALAGPVVKGMCVLSRADIFASSKVGQVVNAKYRTAFEQAQRDITKGREALEAEAKILQAKKAAINADEFQKSQTGLAERVKVLQTKANEQTQVLEATRRDVVARIATEAQPVIEEIYKERGCGLLLSREAVLAGNIEMDVTPAVIAALDKRIADLPFEKQPAASSAAR